MTGFLIAVVVVTLTLACALLMWWHDRLQRLADVASAAWHDHEQRCGCDGEACELGEALAALHDHKEVS